MAENDCYKPGILHNYAKAHVVDAHVERWVLKMEQLSALRSPQMSDSPRSTSSKDNRLSALVANMSPNPLRRCTPKQQSLYLARLTGRIPDPSYAMSSTGHRVELDVDAATLTRDQMARVAQGMGYAGIGVRGVDRELRKIRDIVWMTVMDDTTKTRSS